MNKFQTLFWLLGLGMALLAFLKDRSPVLAETESSQPLEGTLFSGPIEEMEKAQSPVKNLWQGTVSDLDIKELGLGPEITEIRLQVVPDSSAQYALLTKEKARAKKPSGTRQGARKSPPTNPPSRAAIPVPLSEYSFKFFDEILKKNEFSYAVNHRYSKGGVTFNVESLCQWNNLYVLKFSVLNEEPGEFFIARVNIQNGGGNVTANLYAPFSCRPQETIEGILTFPVQGMKNTQASSVLIEGGEHGRTYPVQLGYAF